MHGLEYGDVPAEVGARNDPQAPDEAGAEASASTNASSPGAGGGSSSEQCEYRPLLIASDVPVRPRPDT